LQPGFSLILAAQVLPRIKKTSNVADEKDGGQKKQSVQGRTE